jgi:hypothetical protein
MPGGVPRKPNLVDGEIDAVGHLVSGDVLLLAGRARGDGVIGAGAGGAGPGQSQGGQGGEVLGCIPSSL